MPVTISATVVPRQELALTIMEGASLNRSLIWKEVLPEFGVDDRTAHLPKLGIAAAELMRIITELSAPGADVPRMTATVGDFSFSPAIRKQEIGIPVEAEMTYAKLFSLESFYSQQLGNKALALTLEYLAAQAIFSTANFGSATNSSTAYTLANLASISLVSDIFAAIERVRGKGEEPNTIIIPAQVYQRLIQSKAVVDFVIGQLGAGSQVTTTTLQQAFASEGIEKVLIGRATYNSAVKDSVTLSRIWSNDYIWVGRAGYKNTTSDEGVPIIDGVGGMTYWKPFGLVTAESYGEPKNDQQVIRGKTSGNPVIFNSNAGTLIATQYA